YACFYYEHMPVRWRAQEAGPNRRDRGRQRPRRRGTMNDARLSASSECFGTALRKASRRVTALYDETLAPSGLRSTQFAILAEIVDRDEGPQTASIAGHLARGFRRKAQ